MDLPRYITHDCGCLRYITHENPWIGTLHHPGAIRYITHDAMVKIQQIQQVRAVIHSPNNARAFLTYLISLTLGHERI